jgi:hypothetical protein
MDHTFRIAKYIRQDGDRPFGALWSCMNEYGEIQSQVFTVGTKFDDYKPSLERLVERLDHVAAVYIDNCCQVGDSIKTLLPDVLIRLDCYHFMDRILRLAPKDHVLYKQFAKDLSLAILEVCPTDLLECQELLLRKINEGIKPWIKHVTCNCRQNRATLWLRFERHQSCEATFSVS